LEIGQYYIIISCCRFLGIGQVRCKFKFGQIRLRSSVVKLHFIFFFRLRSQFFLW